MSTISSQIKVYLKTIYRILKQNAVAQLELCPLNITFGGNPSGGLGGETRTKFDPHNYIVARKLRIFNVVTMICDL